MSDYSTAYFLLFNAITDALEQIDKRNYGIAVELLKNAQIKAEEIFLDDE